MASDDSSGARPAAPIVIRIKLRYDDVEAMVQRFAANVGKSGLFLPTKSLQPLGTEIKFELRLSDDTPALVGLGRVKAATPPDAEHPRAAFGMAIELMRVTPQSRALILRMLERRRTLGLPEVALPMAADIEAARRAELATGPVPVVPGGAGTPAPVPVPSPVSSVIPSVPPGEGLMTAPRRTTAPMPVAKVMVIAPLMAEAPRRRRASMSELIETASGPIASMSIALPGLDDDVDVGAVLARARVLAGGALDAELEALADVAAVPVEVSIEAASVELARQLGGQAMRDRWAPPPPTVEAAPPVAEAEAAAPEAAEAIEAAPESAGAIEAAPEPADAIDAGPEAVEAIEAAPEPADAIEAPAEAVEAALLGAAPVELDEIDEPLAVAPEPLAAGDVHEVEPDQIADVIHQLNELDFEDAEHTEMGAIPTPPEPAEPTPSIEPVVFEPDPAAAPMALVDESDPEPEPEPRDDDRGSAPHDLSLDEFDDFEIIAEADAADEDLLTSNAERETSSLRAPMSRPTAPVDGRGTPPAGSAAEWQRGSIDRPSEPDFASRLDLDDDGDFYIPPPRGDGFGGGHADPLLASAGQALAAFETGDEPLDDEARPPARVRRDGELPRIVHPIFEPEPSSSYTLAAIPSDDSLDLDLGPALRDRAEPRPTKLPPPGRGDGRLPSLYASPVEDDELEQALGALDVDLDDLALPQAGPARTPNPRAARPAAARPAPEPARPTQPARTTQSPVRTSQHVVPAAGRRTTGTTPAAAPSAPRVTTDDGLEIDFDDE